MSEYLFYIFRINPEFYVQSPLFFFMRLYGSEKLHAKIFTEKRINKL